jgi:hypothetical protein
MRLNSIGYPIVCLAIASSVACSGTTTSPSTTTTTPTGSITNEVLTGSVAPPVNNVLQSAANPFTVSQSNGTLSVTLTSAVETMPDGSLLPTVTMGLGVGNWSNGTCTLISNAFVTAQGGSAAQLTGTISAGSYCVQVSDVTSQLGPVAYAVALSHY